MEWPCSSISGGLINTDSVALSQTPGWNSSLSVMRDRPSNALVPGGLSAPLSVLGVPFQHFRFKRLAWKTPEVPPSVTVLSGGSSREGAVSHPCHGGD